MSTGQPNVRTANYRDLLDRLPDEIQKSASASFKQFLENPNHPSLENHELADTRRGRHRRGSRAVSITRRYRAIYVEDGSTNVWYWIGSHEDYNNFTGKK